MKMLKAIVTKEFSGAADGEVYPKVQSVGSVITGDLARAAIGMGCADEDKAPPAADLVIDPDGFLGNPPKANSTEAAPRNAKLKGADRRK